MRFNSVHIMKLEELSEDLWVTLSYEGEVRVRSALQNSKMSIMGSVIFSQVLTFPGDPYVPVCLHL